MANMNLNVNMENLTEEERNQFLALVKKAIEEKKVWKPAWDDGFYFINKGIVINRVKYLTSMFQRASDYGYEADYLYAIGNCFQTKEEAEFAVERLKVIAELKRFAQEHNEKEIDWRDYSQCKYYIYCEYHEHVEYIDVGCAKECKSNDIYFTSEEIAQQAIDTIGEDRIKKYYLGVED